VAEVCRQIGIAEATIYIWKKGCGNLAVAGIAEVREIRQLREGNAHLKRVVADLTPDRRRVLAA
jgi:putative transposase